MLLALRVYSSFTSGDWLLALLKLYQVIKNKKKGGGAECCLVEWLETNLRVYFTFSLFFFPPWDSVKADHSVNSRSAWAVINTSILIKGLNRLDWWGSGNIYREEHQHKCQPCHNGSRAVIHVSRWRGWSCSAVAGHTPHRRRIKPTALIPYSVLKSIPYTRLQPSKQHK